ncbi:MOSC domain-containing protein [Haliea sp. E1-2-M8]|uniref:MOSC domain-containing protein n=1 Tax=Haliea sp. E1-2-M8 TaxID=3064706 RepID=UPI0027237622|nr:MOSC domain-containing protein [Haliea sp. E1-2-M8]MDO8860099.1 MOSC domain-containing protein [Haliea sp. E1-2-M8]
MIELCGIAIRARPKAPMETQEWARVTPERGVEGDFRGRPGKRQVTVMSRQSWTRVCAELGEDLPWMTRRANLFISGIEFTPDDVGNTLHLGDLVLQITCETDPCKRMDQARPGLRAALDPDWRGGVCCRVIAGGEISLGQRVDLLSAAP